MSKVLKKPSHAFSLTELGASQAKQAGDNLHARFDLTSFDAYFASTYSRSQETFELMFRGRKKKGHQITPIIDARINEITRGYASLISDEEIFAKHPQEVETLKLNGWFHNIPLCGQSCVQIEHIIQSFLSFLREACGGKKVIVVGHGTWINLCCRILANKPIDEAERLHAEGYYINCGATIFKRDPDTGSLILAEENVKTWE
jgi:broad specificity phosphatase PhoE